MNCIINSKHLTITPETITSTREWYINNANLCIEQAVSGEVRVNNLESYVKWQRVRILDIEAGNSDHTLSFVQMAVYIQTKESVPILS